jgi:hypothetical protein
LDGNSGFGGVLNLIFAHVLNVVIPHLGTLPFGMLIDAGAVYGEA